MVALDENSVDQQSKVSGQCVEGMFISPEVVGLKLPILKADVQTKDL